MFCCPPGTLGLITDTFFVASAAAPGTTTLGHPYPIETFCQLTSRGLKADVFNISMLPASNMYSLCGIVWIIV